MGALAQVVVQVIRQSSGCCDFELIAADRLLTRHPQSLQQRFAAPTGDDVVDEAVESALKIAVELGGMAELRGASPCTAEQLTVANSHLALVT